MILAKNTYVQNYLESINCFFETFFFYPNLWYKLRNKGFAEVFYLP